MQANRSHRDARRTGAGRPLRAEVLFALLALVAQLVVPHLHRWQVATHPGPVAHPAQWQPQSTSTPVPVLGVADLGAAHAESSCPICQALAASHAYVAPAGPHVASAATRLVPIALLEARSAHAPAGEHAPRGPPRTA